MSQEQEQKIMCGISFGIIRDRFGGHVPQICLITERGDKISFTADITFKADAMEEAKQFMLDLYTMLQAKSPDIVKTFPEGKSLKDIHNFMKRETRGH